MDLTIGQGLNWYDLFRDNPQTSLLQSADERTVTKTINGVERQIKLGMTASEYTPWLKHVKQVREVVMAKSIGEYLNLPAVKTALHVNSTQDYWFQCT